jgi:hypothetical protein
MISSYAGHRLYDVRTDRIQPYSTIMPVTEERLEKAPAELLTGEEAIQRGFSTDNWPRQEFAVRYTRKGTTNHWTAKLEVGPVIEGLCVSGVVGTARSRWDPEPPGNGVVEVVTVRLEYDPRLRDVRSDPGIWPAMVEDAQRQADRWFKTKHPKAVIERD